MGEHWRRLEELYHAALERPQSERAIFLEKACGDDVALRDELASLLAREADGERFLERPVLEAVARELGDDVATKSGGDPGLVGTTLAHYRIEKQIGAGGMGEVYLARDPKLRRAVAIKVIPFELIRDAERKRRFLEEARAAAAIEHAHIAAIFDIDEADDRTFIVMEYVRGQSLRQLLATRAVSSQEAVELVRQVADGLAKVHAHGIVHRDLKPENVLVTEEGNVKIVDFGLAKLVEPAFASQMDTQKELSTVPLQTTPNQILGTPAYMSPEQVRGEVVDARSDLFSLGVILYELLTGSSPFRRDSAAEMFGAILHETPQPLRLDRDLSPELRRVVDKALEKDPEDRYPSAKALMVDLRRLGTAADRPQADVARSSSSTKVVAGAAAVVALAVALWMGGSSLGLWGAELNARTLLIPPMEVRGQVDGADYAGRAFAEALAVNLTQVKDLTVLPVPEPGEPGERKDLSRVDAAREVRAGLMLTGALSREKGGARARLSLVDTAENRILWGAEKESADGSLSDLAILLSQELLIHLGGTARRMYESHHVEAPSSALAAAPEFVEARVGLTSIKAPVEATQRLVDRFPDDPLVRVMHADAVLQAAWGALPGSPARAALEESLAAIDRVDPNNPWDDLFRALFGVYHDGSPLEAIEQYSRLLARDDLTPGARAHILGHRGQAR